VFGQCVPNSATCQHVPAVWFSRWTRLGPNDIHRGLTASAARVRSLIWINQTAYEMKATKYGTNQINWVFRSYVLLCLPWPPTVHSALLGCLGFTSVRAYLITRVTALGKRGWCLNLAKTHDNRNNMFSIQTIGLVKQIHVNAMQSHPMIHQST